jgi:hypothetical protein
MVDMKTASPGSELSGRRRSVQQWIRRATFAFAVTSVVGYVIPSHALFAHDAHSYLTDLGVGPLLAFLAAAAVAGWGLLDRSRGRGYFVGAAAIAAVGAFVAKTVLVLPHMFEDVVSRPGDVVAAAGAFGLLVAGVVAVVSEIVLFRLELRSAPTRSAI